MRVTALPASLPLTNSVVTAISLAIVFQKIKYTPDFEARNSEPRSESVWSMYSRVKLTGDEEVGESEEAINVGLALPEIEITWTLNCIYSLILIFKRIKFCVLTL